MNSNDVLTSEEVYLDFCRQHDRCTPHKHGGCMECAGPELPRETWRREQIEREKQEQAETLRAWAIREQNRKRRRSANLIALRSVMGILAIVGSAAIAWLSRAR